MLDPRRIKRWLRWYPVSWRRRYGEEMASLLNDIHATSNFTMKDKLTLARSGTVERARAGGLVGDTTGRAERVVAGSLSILCGWSCFVVAGSIFAKFAEHWDVSTPIAKRQLPRLGYLMIESAAFTGVLIVLSAAMLSVPAFIRFVRSGQWESVVGALRRAGVAAALSGALTIAVGVIAHRLSDHARNGGSWSYGALFLTWGFSVVVVVALCTALVVAVARRLELSSRALLAVRYLAVTLTLAMVVVFVGTIVWWASEASNAPRFLGGALGGAHWPAALDVAGALMLLGLIGASVGVVRLTGGRRVAPSPPTP